MEQPAFRFSLFAAAIAAMAASHPLKAAPGDKVGPEFRVSKTATGDQSSPDIARSANGDFVVVWSERDAGPDDSPRIDGDIFLRRYHANGTAKDADPVAVIPPDFLTFCQRYLECDDARASSPRVAMDADGDFIVTWSIGQSFYGDFSEDYGRRFLKGGLPATDVFPIFSESLDETSLAAIAMDASGDYVVVYEDYALDGHSYYDNMHAEGFSSDGQLLGTSSPSSVDAVLSTTRPVIDMDPDGDYVIAFNVGGFDGFNDDCWDGYCPTAHIGVRRFSTDGTPKDAGDILVANTYTYDPVTDVALDAAGGFIVTWSSYRGSASQVFMRRYNADGTPKGPAAQVNAPGSGQHFDSKIGIAADGSFTVSWTRENTNRTDSDIFWRSFRPDGTPTLPFHTRFNTTTTDFQASPAMAVNADGSFVVAWRREVEEGDDLYRFRTGTGIFAQRFEGNPAPPPRLPVVTFARAGFAVDESAGLVNVRVTLFAVSASPVTVPLRLGGTATRNSDYRLPGNSVVIPAGARFANVPVTIINDRKREPRESLTLTMGKPANATKGAITGFELAIKKSD